MGDPFKMASHADSVTVPEISVTVPEIPLDDALQKGLNSSGPRVGSLDWLRHLSDRAIVRLLAAFTFIVGCVDLGRASLWLDEALSIELAKLPLESFLHRLVTFETNQSLYFVLFRLWPLHGSDEVGARLLSVLFTTATAPLLFHLGRHLYDRATGVIAAILLAVLPFALQATQEARGYSLLMLVATGSTLALVRAAEHGGYWWAAYGFGIGALAYTQFYGSFIVVGQLLWAACWVTERRRLLMAAAIGALLAVPIGVNYVSRGSGHLFFLSRPDWPFFVEVLRKFGAGHVPVGGALLLLGVVGLVVGLFRARRATSLLLAWIMVGAAVPLGYSILVSPIFQERYLAGLTPAFVLLLAVGIRALPPPPVQAVATIVLTVGLLVLLQGRFGPWLQEDWRAAAARLDAEVGPQDQTIAYPTYEAAGINAYRNSAQPPLIGDGRMPLTADRVWVVGRSDPPDIPGYRIVSRSEVGRVKITLFAR